MISGGTCYPFVIDYLYQNCRPGDLVVETGCGGALYRNTIEKFGATYLGCDLPNDQYKNYSAVSFFSTGNELPIITGKASLIFNQAAFDYIPNPQKTVSEAYRILRPGGKFTIFTYKEKVLKKIDGNCRKRGRSWESKHHVYKRNDVLTWLEDAGFEAYDISNQIDIIRSSGLRRRILNWIGLYMSIQAMYSYWLVFEAIKPK